MTAIEIYKYINDNGIDYRWQENSDNHNEPDIIIFPFTFQMDEFYKLIKDYGRDEGIKCILMNGYFAIYMYDICDYYDINIEEVFGKQEIEN